MSGKTDYLVIGIKLEDGRAITEGSKYAGAKSRNIKIINEHNFQDLVRERSGIKDFELSIRKNVMAGMN